MSCLTGLRALDLGDELNLSATQQAVLMALAIRANGARVCNPSVERITLDTRLSRRTVFAALVALERLGLLHREQRCGMGDTTYYHLTLPVSTTADPVQEMHGGPPPPVQEVHRGPPPPRAGDARGTPPSPVQQVHPEEESLNYQGTPAEKEEAKAASSQRRSAPLQGPREEGGLFEPPPSQPRRAAPVKPKKPADPEYDRLWKEGPARLRAVFPNWTAKDAQVAVGRLLKESMRAPRPIWEVIEAAERQDAISEPWPWLNSRLARALRQPPPPVDRGYGPTKEGQIAFAEEARNRALWEARQAARASA